MSHCFFLIIFSSTNASLSIISTLGHNITFKVVQLIGNVPVSIRTIENRMITNIHGPCFAVSINESPRHGNIPDPVTLVYVFVVDNLVLHVYCCYSYLSAWCG